MEDIINGIVNRLLDRSIPAEGLISLGALGQAADECCSLDETSLHPPNWIECLAEQPDEHSVSSESSESSLCDRDIDLSAQFAFLNTLSSSPSIATASSKTSEGSSTAGDESLMHRLRAKHGRLMARPAEQGNCSNISLVSDATTDTVNEANDVNDTFDGWADLDVTFNPQPGAEELNGNPAKVSGYVPPIHVVNLFSRRDYYHYGQSRLLGTADIPSADSAKPSVGNVVTSDLSHLAIDFRDLAVVKELQHSESGMTTVLSRWCLRRIFRTDWRRDCFLCDLPLTHSCLMCFSMLHAAPDSGTSTRGFNAVVCSVLHTECGHVYHQHCWTRWSTELTACCPKCGCANVVSKKEVFIIEKRCG